MKKVKIVFILIVLSIFLTSCNYKHRKELTIFLKDLTKEDILNYVEKDEGRYGVYLASSSPTFYNTFSDEKKHVIIVRTERSFSYFENIVELEEAKQKRHIYYFDKSEKKLYFKEGDSFNLVAKLDTVDLYNIVKRIHINLGEIGNILTFDSLYPVIKQFYKGIKKRDLELHGKTSFLIRTKYKNNYFLENNPEFIEHLNEIYNESNSVRIIDSIRNNKIDNITVSLDYNDNKTISPRIKIFYKYKVYYVIDPLAEDYNIDMELIN